MIDGKEPGKEERRLNWRQLLKKSREKGSARTGTPETPEVDVGGLWGRIFLEGLGSQRIEQAWGTPKCMGINRPSKKRNHTVEW